ncbi:MAG: aspartate--ammonia ligase, partial [Bacteroidales bacterium]|nr:aspartate--ammonia ligase [Bacteroidales bacterium]
GLNGDIIVWHPVLECALELSSMGVRVDRERLLHQLKERGCCERAQLSFHKMLLDEVLPQSIGGGIGQSRVCMFMLKKTHIGEVQVGIWSDDERCRQEMAGVSLL